LLEDINAITKARIGALVGESRAKLMHDLKATLDTHQRLHSSLNDTTDKAFGLVLNEFRDALMANKLTQAKDIHRTAALLSELNSNTDLAQTYLELASSMYLLQKDFDRAFDMQRKLVDRQLLIEDNFQPDTRAAFVRYIDLLSWRGFRERSLRLLDAVLTLGGKDTENWPSIGLLKTLRAHLLLETGRLREAVQEAISATHRIAPHQRHMADTARIRTLLFSGALSARSALGSTELSRQGTSAVLWYTMVTEDVEGLDETLRSVNRSLEGADHLGIQYTHITDYAGALRDALQGKRVKPPEVDEANLTLLESLAYSVISARIAALTGDAGRAREWVVDASKRARALPAGCSQTIAVRVMHARNVIEFGEDDAEATAARDELNSLRQAGYRFERVTEPVS
jgi:hypothetical protein